MKKNILLCIILLTGVIFSQTEPDATRNPTSSAVINEAPEFDAQNRGCCSWHGGVCGCSAGRAVCCDGTFSPSCGC